MDGQFRLKGRETKSGVNADAAREKRMAKSDNARDKDRQAHLQSQRRRTNNQHFEAAEEDAKCFPMQLDQEDVPPNEILADAVNINALVYALNSTRPEVVLDSIRRLRRLTGLQDQQGAFGPDVAENHHNHHHHQHSHQFGVTMINAEAIDVIAGLFMNDLTRDNMTILFEATWCVSNLISSAPAAGQLLIQSQVFPFLSELLINPLVPSMLHEQIIWLIGNTAANSACRDQLLELEILQPLVVLASSQVKLSLLRSIAWALANLARIIDRKNHPEFIKILEVVPTFQTMIKFLDEETVAHASWGLQSLTSDDPNNSQKLDILLQSPDFIPTLVHVYRTWTHTNAIKHPIFLIFGHISRSDNPTHLDALFEAGVVPLLLEAARSPDAVNRYKAAWVLSNLAAGGVHHVERLAELDVFVELYNLQQTALSDVRFLCEILWTISNAASNGNAATLHSIAVVGWLSALCGYLSYKNSDQVITLSLDALTTFFLQSSEIDHVIHQVNGQMGSVNRYLTEVQGIILQPLEDLKNHSLEDIRSKASQFGQRFFGITPDYTNQHDDYHYDETGNIVTEMGAFDNDVDGDLVQMGENDVNPDAMYDFD